MAVMTAKERLEAVQATIDAIVSGGVSSYTINGRKLDALPLSELRQMERELKLEIQRTARGGLLKPGGFTNG